MTLHIFNPEHDIALASGLSNFTAPHAGRQLRHDIGFLPALWADPDDMVLVDDVEAAEKGLRRFLGGTKVRGNWGTRSLLGIESATGPFLSLPTSLPPCPRIEPWGWNSALRAYLLRKGISQVLLPSEAALETIRQLSHRRTAAQLLPLLRLPRTVGEAVECRTEEEVALQLSVHGKIVLKAPWSSSGRGLRFASGADDMERLKGWLRNLIASQGSVMSEPYYHKVKDFALEFFSDGEGRVTYEGLSLFHTENGAYTGNILATEAAKRESLSRYLPLELLDEVQHIICAELGRTFMGKYQGPFGVDMMAVNNGQCDLHPCVEINMRRTMGHIALALEQKLNPTFDPDLRHVMRIVYSENKYQLIVKRL